MPKPLPTRISRDVRLGVLRLVVICGGLLTLYAVLPFQSDKWWIGATIGLSAIIAIVPLTIKRVARISSSHHPVMATIEALALIVAMLVLGFSGLYLTIDRDATEFYALETRLDAVYFTVATLSTVGYGDIHASGQTARAFVTVQILIDFTLLAFAIKMVTLTARRRFVHDPSGDLLQRRGESPPSDDAHGA